MKLSIIIINDHHLTTLQKCVHSFMENPPPFEHEIYITDNSGEKQCADFISTLPEPFIPFGPGKPNTNFSRIQNVIIPKAKGAYFLFFDSDASLMPGSTLEKCSTLLDAHPEIGVLTCKLIRNDGKVDPNCRRSIPTLWSAFTRVSGLSGMFPKSRLFSGYRMTYLDENESSFMECAYIAFMMVRKEVFEEIGLMDEEIYKYGEDLDFSIRAGEKGWKIYYYADAQAIHHSIMINDLEEKMRIESFKTVHHLFNKHLIKQYGLLGGTISGLLGSVYRFASGNISDKT